MTAREMFEKKGFEFIETNDMIIYRKKYMNHIVVEIKFAKYLKAVFVSGIRHAVMLDCELLKAIEKQYKELGWIR